MRTCYIAVDTVHAKYSSELLYVFSMIRPCISYMAIQSHQYKAFENMVVAQQPAMAVLVIWRLRCTRQTVTCHLTCQVAAHTRFHHECVISEQTVASFKGFVV